MNLYEIPLFGMLRVKMDWINERQRTLADNIANATTVGYKARDLKPMSFEQLLERSRAMSENVEETGQKRVHVRRTEAGFQSEDARDGEMTPNGNSVVLEEQMMKVSESQVQFQTAIDIYRQGLSMLRIAVGRQ